VALTVAVIVVVMVAVKVVVKVLVEVTGEPGVATLMIGCVGNAGILLGAIGGVVAAGGGVEGLLPVSEQANIEAAKKARPMKSRQRMFDLLTISVSATDIARR
jgi:hypothetical protein